MSLITTCDTRVLQIAIRICLLIVMIDYAGVGMMRTILPFYATQLGCSATVTGMLESCYGTAFKSDCATMPIDNLECATRNPNFVLKKAWGRSSVLQC